MTPPGPTWVVGAGGLLGRQVSRRLADPMTVNDVPWSMPVDANALLRQGIRTLLDQADGGPWNVVWCAGAGVVATPTAEVEQERVVFERFVADLATEVGSSSHGAIFFASSAGGLYADSSGPPFTERTEPRPRTPYGHAKLAMERSLRELVDATQTRVLVGRIANLYGPGQNLGKRQGLVSQVCLTHLTGQPLSLYVPADTLRDYLYVEDCARMVVAGLGGLRARPERFVVKVMASGRSVTAGGLIGETTRLFRRRPRVVFGASAAAQHQVRDIRLRSVEWPELDALARTPLPVGIARTADDVARRLRAGRRAAQPPRPGRVGA
jgi:UDP-glucose 4-epimerase